MKEDMRDERIFCEFKDWSLERVVEKVVLPEE